MMSPSDTSLVEEEGANVEQADRDGAGWVGVVESVYHDLNYTSVHFTIATSMAQI